jgi:uncharacterized membrane protein HdeD (DUF308 family)
MATRAEPDRNRARLITLAGVVIILLSAGALLLPAAGDLKDSVVIGALLAAAGVVEILAGLLRGATKPFAIAAGCLTLLAGLVFLLKPTDHFFPNVILVVAWLVARSLILAVASRRAGGSVRSWTMISAGIDLVLAVLLATGLSIATIIVSLFGPTPPLIASFAWVLAASFVVNGLMMLEVASCERSPE